MAEGMERIEVKVLRKWFTCHMSLLSYPPVHPWFEPGRKVNGMNGGYDRCDETTVIQGESLHICSSVSDEPSLLSWDSPLITWLLSSLGCLRVPTGGDPRGWGWDGRSVQEKIGNSRDYRVNSQVPTTWLSLWTFNMNISLSLRLFLITLFPPHHGLERASKTSKFTIIIVPTVGYISDYKTSHLTKDVYPRRFTLFFIIC